MGTMPFNDGDYILIDYIIKVKENDRVIDTTIEEEAKKAGVYEEGKVYGPELVIIGEGWILKSAEEEIKKMNVGEEKTFEIPPEKAFGQRDPSKIRVVSIRDLQRRNIRPKINEIINFDGKPAIVKRIGSGRVILDFKHPLAGKTLVYTVKVVKKIEKTEDKIKELIRRRIHLIDLNKVNVTIEDSTATVLLPLDLLSYSNINLALRGIIRDIDRYIKEISAVKIIFEATFKRETAEKPKKEEEKPEKLESKSASEKATTTE